MIDEAAITYPGVVPEVALEAKRQGDPWIRSRLAVGNAEPLGQSHAS